MTANNSIQKFADDFWRYASNTKGIVAIEDAFINWAKNSNMTTREFSRVWARIHDDISTKFGLKKADISFSRTDDILDLVDLLKNTGVENIENVLSETSSVDEKETPPELEPDGLSSTSSPESLENETPGLELEKEEETPDLKLTESLLL